MDIDVVKSGRNLLHQISVEPEEIHMLSSTVEPFRAKGDLELLVREEPIATPTAFPGSTPITVPPRKTKIRCHSTLLKLASPLLEDLLESCQQQPSDDTPAATLSLNKTHQHQQQQQKESLAVLEVEGSSEAWLDILEYLYRL